MEVWGEMGQKTRKIEHLRRKKDRSQEDNIRRQEKDIRDKRKR